MRHKLWNLLAICTLVALVLGLAPFMATAQETTGGIKGYVKDKSGAVVPGAKVEISSPALITPRTLTSDGAGYFYASALPPGSYTVTVSASGFRAYKHSGISLSAGELPTFEVLLEVGAVTETVEVTGQAPVVDVTTSKVAVTITPQDINTLPHGRSYQSVIGFAPGARQEPLQSSRTDRNRQNGFQIDGSSDSENTYLVEGMDTSNVEQGGIKQGVIFEFVQEVQVKTAGTEAEFGGAMGGVVNVIQKRGSNQWHGGFVAHFRSDKFDANDQCTTTPQPSSAQTPSGQQISCGLRYDPTTSSNGNPVSGLVHDQAPNYYIQKKDQSSTVEAGYQIGGPIWKDKLWMFSSYIPTVDRLTRTVNFTTVGNAGPRDFTRSYTAHNMLNRLDFQPFSKLHLFGGWQYGYSRIKGQLPTFPDSAIGQVNTIASSDPYQFRPDRGSVNPSNIFNFGGDWTPNSRTLVSVKYGYFYYNMEDRGLPAGLRYVYQTDLNTSTPSPVTGLPIDPSGSVYDNASSFANMSSNLSTKNDIFSRKTLAMDASYSVSKWGQHNFKGGYGFNRLYNNIFQNFNTAVINLFYGQVFTPVATDTQGVANCAAIVAANQVVYPSATGCAGTAGYFTISDGVETNGVASSYNHGFYGQDSWSVGHGLTLNIGIRFEKEHLPPYSPGNPEVNFGFGDKIAPRIGGAYDLFHNGKFKIFASYGKFYDIMKYSLPRGSFGGDYWHDCTYAMDFINYTTITPTSPGGHSCGPDSGPSVGVSVGRFITNYNWRAPAGSATDPGVDPNLKPMSQHEYLVGADWAISPKLGLEVRYARKRLDNAVDDMSIDDGTYYIGNPGPSTYSDLLHRALPAAGYDNPICMACPLAPKATRRYDGLESRLTYRTARIVGLVSYTYSRLYGNYSGLTDTDITDGNGGRHNANNNRSFDLPEMQYTTSGKVVDGPLGTDRPNVLNMSGSYILRWFGMESTFGLIQSIAQGSPKSTCVPTVDSASSCQFYDQRGTWANFAQDPVTGVFSVTSVETGARMPTYTQTDFSLAHSFKVSKSNEAMRLTFEFEASNILNQHAVVSVSPSPFRTSYLTFPTLPQDQATLKFLTGYDVAAEATAQGNLILNSRYGLPLLFQTSRTMRLGVRFNF